MRDRVLASVGAALLGAVRRHDVVGRLGGGEFALLLPGADRDRALAVLHRLTETVAQVPSTAGQPVGCSIGAVTFVSPPETVEGALAEADALMYRVKARGKGAFQHDARG